MAKQRVVEAVLRFRDDFSAKFKQASSTMNMTKKQINQMGRDFYKAGQSMQRVGRSLTKNVTMPIVGLGVASSKMYMDFDKAMAKVGGIADASGIKMDGMQQKILALSDKTGVAAADIASNVDDAISAGQTTQKGALDSVEAAVNLSKAGFTETGNALDILTTIQNSYGKSAGTAQEISDMLIMTQNRGKVTVDELSSSMGKLIPTAVSNNVTLQDVSAGYIALTKNGAKARDATTWMNSAYNELSKSSSNVAKVLKKETGQSFDELIKSGKNVGDVLQILQKYSEKTGTKFNDLWGNTNSRKAANSLLNNLDDYKAGLNDVAKSSGTTEAALRRLGKTDSAKLTKALNRLKNDMIKLGATVLPVVMPYIEKGLKFIDNLAKKFDSLSPKQKDMIVKIGLMAAAAGPLLTAGGKVTSLFGNLLQGRTGIQTLGSTLGKLGGHFSKIGGLLKTAFLAIPGPVKIAIAVIAALAIAGVLIYKNWDKIKAKAKEVFGKLGPIMKPIVVRVMEIASKLKVAFTSIAVHVKARVKVLKKQFAEMIEAARPVVAKIKAFLKPLLTFLGKVFQKGVMIVLERLEANLKMRIEQAKIIINGIMDVLSGIISFITNVFKGNWKGAWEDVKGILKTVWDTFTGVIKVPLNGMIDLVNRAIGSLNKLKISIPDYVPKFGGKTWSLNIPAIPHLYRGTENWAGGLAVIHDKGGEVVDLPQGSRVYPHEKSQKMMAPSININISNMSVRSDEDIDLIASQLFNRMQLAWSNVG